MKFDLDAIMEIAHKEALKSNMKYKISTVLVDDSGSVVACGYNHLAVNGRKMGRRSVHSETDALNKVMKPSCNLTAFIYRMGGNGRSNRISPCSSCSALLKSYGIRVIYCTWDNVWIKHGGINVR